MTEPVSVITDTLVAILVSVSVAVPDSVITDTLVAILVSVSEAVPVSFISVKNDTRLDWLSDPVPVSVISRTTEYPPSNGESSAVPDSFINCGAVTKVLNCESNDVPVSVNDLNAVTSRSSVSDAVPVSVITDTLVAILVSVSEAAPVSVKSTGALYLPTKESIELDSDQVVNVEPSSNCGCQKNIPDILSPVYDGNPPDIRVNHTLPILPNVLTAQVAEHLYHPLLNAVIVALVYPPPPVAVTAVKSKNAPP